MGPAEAPQDGPRRGNGGDGVHVAGGDVVGAVGVFVDAVDVEVVEGVVRGEAVVTYRCQRVGDVVVVGSFPLEKQSSGGDVDFLEEAIDDPAGGGSAEGGEVGAKGKAVDGHECGAGGREAEFVQVAEDVAGGFNGADDVVGGIELYQFSYC